MCRLYHHEIIMSRSNEYFLICEIFQKNCDESIDKNLSFGFKVWRLRCRVKDGKISQKTKKPRRKLGKSFLRG